MFFRRVSLNDPCPPPSCDSNASCSLLHNKGLMLAIARTALTWEAAVTACPRFNVSMALLSGRRTGRRARRGFSRQTFARVRVGTTRGLESGIECYDSALYVYMYTYIYIGQPVCLRELLYYLWRSSCHPFYRLLPRKLCRSS